MEEVWRHVDGHENYMVSSYGRVKRIGSIRSKYCSIINNETCQQVSIDGRLVSVSRLVATTFIPNPKKRKYVRHKDGNIFNNQASNIEWISPGSKKKVKDNKEKTTNTIVEMYDLDGVLINTFDSVSEAAEFSNKSRCSINQIIIGKAKSTREGWTYKRIYKDGNRRQVGD